MSESFYRVSFEQSGDAYFFHNHESAVEFLLESYFDDYEVKNEEEVMEVNNEVADTDAIESYGSVDEVWFED